MREAITKHRGAGAGVELNRTRVAVGTAISSWQASTVGDQDMHWRQENSI